MIINPQQVSLDYIVNAPIGSIILWSGTDDTIPDGWHICNGEDGNKLIFVYYCATYSTLYFFINES